MTKQNHYVVKHPDRRNAFTVQGFAQAKQGAEDLGGSYRKIHPSEVGRIGHRIEITEQERRVRQTYQGHLGFDTTVSPTGDHRIPEENLIVSRRRSWYSEPY